MAPFDRLRRRSLAAEPAPQTEAKGGSGRYHTDGFLDLDEINAVLRGREGLRKLDEMWRTDADCRKALTMVVAAMVGGTWSTEAPGDGDEDPPTDTEQQATEFVEWSLFEAMRPKLHAHLWSALTIAGRFGNAPHEQIWKLDEWNGRQVWTIDTLDPRLPKSVDRYLQDGPRLTGIEQFAPGVVNGKAAGRTHIPAEDLVFYRFGAEGDNWEGQSLLRAAYKHWKYKSAIERIQVMAIERTAMGIPVGYPPVDASDDQLDALESFLANMRASDATYFMAPGPKADTTNEASGWFVEILTPQGTNGDSKAIPDALKHHADKIAASVLEEFMRQGMDNTGTNATADTHQDMFLRLCEALVSIVVEDAINEQLIPRLVDLNFSGVTRYPKLSCSLIDSTTLAELGDYVQKLAQAGALRPEPRLEAFLRARADLPPADEQAIADKQQQEAEQQQAAAEQAHAQALELTQAKGQAPTMPGNNKQMSLDIEGPIVWDAENLRYVTAPRTLARQMRDLKPHETYMQLDRIESAIDGARARFQSTCSDATMAMARDLATQAADGRVAPADAPGELVDAIESELRRLYDTGRSTVKEELIAQAMHSPISQPVLLDAMDRNDPEASALERLRARAQAAADQIRAAVAAALHRTSLHKGTSPADLQIAAERAAQSGLKAAAQDHAAAALNAGRVDQADASSSMIAGAYYTSILDGSRCRDCASADDDVLRPLDDPVRLAHVPPNPECLGGGRCRCLEAYVFNAEAPAAV